MPYTFFLGSRMATVVESVVFVVLLVATASSIFFAALTISPAL